MSRSSDVCTVDHVFYCFGVLEAHLLDENSPSARFPSASYPLFVTWNTNSGRPRGPYRLRGCIGNFSAMSLDRGLAEYALISALEDTRFLPIEEKELPSLQCGVSLLSDFEDASSYLDWDIGTHGIYISFPYPGKPTSSMYRRRSDRPLTATYLPDVIPEQGWTKLEAVDSAIRKAGWDGDIDDALRASVKLRRYQSRHAIATWSEYVEWKRTSSTL